MSTPLSLANPRAFFASLLTAIMVLTAPAALHAEPPRVDALAQPPSDLLAGLQKGVAYSGFRSGQHPDRGDGAVLPTDEQILEDLRILAEIEGFELIRLYDTQQNSQDVLRLIRQNDIPLKVMLGVWLKAELSNHESCAWLTEPIPPERLAANRIDNQKALEQGIELANRYADIVVALNVGNEALVDWNDHLVSLEAMIGYLDTARSRIAQPVTTADNYKVFADHGKQLAPHLDFFAVHTYPAWEGKTVDEALAFTIENLLEAHRAAPDLPIVIAEAGWASSASEFGDRASIPAQRRHFRELMDFGRRHHITVLWFEAFDEDWKGDPNNPHGAEKHWGLYTIDRERK